MILKFLPEKSVPNNSFNLTNAYNLPYMHIHICIYSVSNNFRLKLIEPSAIEVLICKALIEREEREASEERGREHGSNRPKLKTASNVRIPN